jgi:RNA-binding protein
MKLTEAQKKYLRGLGHKLNPTVTVADAGLSDSVLEEFESTIAHHELIKTRFRVGEREVRDAMIEELCKSSGAVLVQRIGNVALLYRPNPEQKKLRLPNG